MAPKPFSVSLASAIGASHRLNVALADCIATADASPLIAYREHAAILRAMLPHVFRMTQILTDIDTATARPARKRAFPQEPTP